MLGQKFTRSIGAPLVVAITGLMGLDSSPSFIRNDPAARQSNNPVAYRALPEPCPIDTPLPGVIKASPTSGQQVSAGPDPPANGSSGWYQQRLA